MLQIYRKLPPVHQNVAVALSVLFALWAIPLVMIPFVLDGTLAGTDSAAAWILGWVVLTLVGVGSAVLMVRWLPHSEDTLSHTSVAVLGFNSIGLCAFAVYGAVIGSIMRPLQLYLPLLLLFAVINVLLVSIGRRTGDQRRWLASGLVISSAVWIGMAAYLSTLPVSVSIEQGTATVTLTSPDGRLLIDCKTLTWQAEGIQTINFGKLFDEPTPTVGVGEREVCKQPDFMMGPYVGTYILYVAFPDNSTAQLGLPLNVLYTRELTLLAVATGVLLLFPTVLLYSRWWVLILPPALYALFSFTLYTFPIYVWAALPLLLIVPWWTRIVDHHAEGWVQSRWTSTAAVAVFVGLVLWGLWAAWTQVSTQPSNLWAAVVVVMTIGAIVPLAKHLWRGNATRRLIDIAILILIPLVIINSDLPYDRFHANAWVGPVNDVMHGKTLFVDATAQYGIGSTLTLAAIFSALPLPLSYTTFGLLAYVLLCGVATGLYAVLRVYLKSIVAPVLFIIVLAIVLARGVFTVSTHPSIGVMRYLPMYLILFVMAARWQRGESQWLRNLEYAIVVLAFAWSVETWVFSWVAYVTMLIYEEIAQSRSLWGGFRHVLRHLSIVTVVATGIAAIYLGSVFLRTGQLPELGQYGIILTHFSGVSSPFFFYWPWFFPTMIYFGTLLMALRELASAPDERSRLMQLAPAVMLAVVGILQLVYWVRLPNHETINTFSIPAVALWGYWLGRALTGEIGSISRWSRAMLLFFGGVMIAAHIQHPPNKTPFTPLVQALVRGDVPALINAPAYRSHVEFGWSLDPEVLPLVDLIQSQTPLDVDRVHLLVDRDTVTDVLMRTGKTQHWHLSSASIEGWIPELMIWVLDHDGYVPQDGDLVFTYADRTQISGLELAIFDILSETVDLESILVTPDGFEVLQVKPR